MTPALLPGIVLVLIAILGGCSRSAAESGWERELERARIAADRGDHLAARAAADAALAGAPDGGPRAACLAVRAAVLGAAGDATAESAWHEALAASRSAYGDTDLRTAACREAIAGLAASRGDAAAACVHLTEVVRVRRGLLGPGHADAARAAAMLGDALRASGRDAEAADAYRAAIAAWVPAGAAFQRERAAARLGLGLALVRSGDAGATTALLAAADEGGDTGAAALAILAGEDERSGRRALALARQEQAVAMLAAGGIDRPEHAGALGDLVRMLASAGEIDRAVMRQREAVKILDRVLAPRDPNLAVAWRNLAGLLAMQGRVMEADAAHRRAAAIEASGN